MLLQMVSLYQVTRSGKFALMSSITQKFDIIMYLFFFYASGDNQFMIFFCFSEFFFLLANVELQTTCCIMTIKHIYVYVSVYIYIYIYIYI